MDNHRKPGDENPSDANWLDREYSCLVERAVNEGVVSNEGELDAIIARPEKGDWRTFAFSPASSDRLPSIPFIAPHECDILSRVQRCFVEAATASSLHIRYSIDSLLGAMLETLEANTGAVFACRGGELSLLTTTNYSRRSMSISLEETRIATHVAKTRKGYYSNDVGADPFYFPDVESTESELAVPICGPNNEVVGVCVLESSRPGAFSGLDVELAESAALGFAPHLLVLNSLDRTDEGWCPWHPDIHGEDLTSILRSVCFAVRYGIEPDSIRSAIWYADHSAERLFLYSSSGYGEEYKHQRSLPFTSVTGQSIQQFSASPRRPKFFRIGSGEEEPFYSIKRLRQMGIKGILSVPIPAIDKEINRGALNIYVGDERVLTNSVEQGLLTVARWTGQLAHSFEKQRQLLASIQQEVALEDGTNINLSSCDKLCKLWEQTFNSPGVTIFGHSADESFLLSSTGLFSVEANEIVAPGTPCNVVECGGYTAASMDEEFRGVCIRANDMIRGVTKETDPNCLEENGPVEPRFRFVENFEPGHPVHRRMLVITVDLANGNMATIRCVRGPKSKPFTKCDQRLLETLVERCISSISSDLVALLADRQSPSVSAERPDWARLTIGHLRPDSRVDTLLGEVTAAFNTSRRKLVQAGVVVRNHCIASPERFRVANYYSEFFKAPPCSDEDEKSHLLFSPEPEWHKWIASGHAVSFGERRTEIRSGVRIPIVAWLHSNLVEGVLAMDSDCSSEWSEDEVRMAIEAAQCIVAAWGSTKDRDDGWTLFAESEQDTKVLMNSFSHHISHAFGLEQCEAHLRHLDVLKKWKPFEPTRTSSQNTDLARFGVRVSPNGRDVAIPLRAIPNVVGVCMCGDVADDQDEVESLVHDVNGSWSRLVVQHRGFRPRRLKATHETSDDLWTWNAGLPSAI